MANLDLKNICFIGLDHISCCPEEDKMPGWGWGGLFYVKAMWGKGTMPEDETIWNTPSRMPRAGENRGMLGSLCMWATVQAWVNAPGMGLSLFTTCVLTSLCLQLVSCKEASLVGVCQIQFKVNFSLILFF